MNFSLLVQLCGYPLLIVLGVLAVVLFAIAIYLVIGAKQQGLLAAFLPLTLLPAIAGLIMTFMDMVSSIGMQLNRETSIALEPAFILQTNLIPLLTGLVAAVPAACVAIAGRWLLAWQASGITILERKSADANQPGENREAHDRWVAKEADEYMEKLTRPR